MQNVGAFVGLVISIPETKGTEVAALETNASHRAFKTLPCVYFLASLRTGR
jgi:hypothetical protein